MWTVTLLNVTIQIPRALVTKETYVREQIRVSSKISNGPIILNVDCDVYSNNSESVRDAMCFFMDENKGHEIAYVQYPQSYNNLTRNDLHGILLRVINEVRHSLCAWTGYNNFLTFSCKSLFGIGFKKKIWTVSGLFPSLVYFYGL